MRPYYIDPYTVEFEANVLEVFNRDGGIGLVLDKSYFYPTSGGQEHDTGTINGIGVTDVFEENGKIIHLLSGEIHQGRVTCKIDWQRRFENMQQHTGQHILSAAFENLFDIQTVSSRLGESIGTIDLSRSPSEDELQFVVAEANKIIQENREVITHFADNSTINSFKLRKAPKVEGTIRIIEVKDFDFSPCGGTHCTHTSEVSVILTGDVEKIKASLTRIEFACGDRAIRHYYELYKSITESVRLLSSLPEDIPIAIGKLKQQVQESGSHVKALTEKILTEVCNSLKRKLKESKGDFAVFDLTDEVATAEELRYVASCLSKQTSQIFSVYKNDGNFCQMNLNLPIKDADIAVDYLKSNFKVKGGGRNGFFSLNFGNNELPNVIEELRKRVQIG